MRPPESPFESPFDRCQQESVEFLSSHYHAGCGDAPGLGKTLTAIRAADRIGAQSHLVICPAGVRTNWWEQTQAHARRPWTWTAISYNEAINPFRRSALSPRFDVCIIDEIHFCKEMDSQRTQAVLGKEYGLAKRAKFIWALSGTWTPNGRPVEYWPVLKTLHPAFSSLSFNKFAQRYCGMYFDGRENNVKGASRVDEFKGLLDQFIIAHTKAQAFPGRKEPIVVRVPVDLSPLSLSSVLEAEKAIMSRPARLSPAAEDYSQMGDMSTVRRLLGEAMVPAVVEFVTEKLEGVRKIALFYQHTNVGARLCRELARFSPVAYRGGMTDAQRDEVVAGFRRPGCRLFIGQQQAAGTGINGLQSACDTVVFAEPDWTPGETEQRIDRLDRKGAVGDIVTAYILYARNTLSAAILGVHDRKDKVREKLQ